MKRSILTLVALVLLAAAGVGAVTLSKKPSQPTPASQTVQTQTPQEVNYQGEDGKTALELLQAKAKVETSGDGANAFVTSINGYQADSSKEFWAFYVNGQQAQVGAGSYQAKNTDKITWKIEAFK